MTDVTQILSRVEVDPSAAEQLLPLVYDELRKLAAAKLASEKPGQTLQATALVHEAFLRLVDQTVAPQWDERGHFFAAAAEAMRRILVERARRRTAEKHGGKLVRVELTEADLLTQRDPVELLALDEALDLLAAKEPEAANLVKLRIFADFPIEEAGKLLGMSRATAYRHWTFARAWLRTQLAREAASDEDGKKSKKRETVPGEISHCPLILQPAKAKSRGPRYEHNFGKRQSDLSGSRRKTLARRMAPVLGSCMWCRSRSSGPGRWIT